jgi:hypothetical protein
MKLITDPVTGDKHTLWNMRDATFEENLKVSSDRDRKPCLYGAMHNNKYRSHPGGQRRG